MGVRLGLRFAVNYFGVRLRLRLPIEATLSVYRWAYDTNIYDGSILKCDLLHKLSDNSFMQFVQGPNLFVSH